MQLASYLSNLRTLPHVIEMRTAEGAEEELRIAFDEVARVMMREAPLIFQDFERDAGGCWEPRFHKCDRRSVPTSRVLGRSPAQDDAARGGLVGWLDPAATRLGRTPRSPSFPLP